MGQRGIWRVRLREGVIMKLMLKILLMIAVFGNCLYVVVTCYGLAFYGQTTAVEPNATIAHMELIESAIVAIAFGVYAVKSIFHKVALNA
jgi:hypothetical protein